jgi:hypothetical protein
MALVLASTNAMAECGDALSYQIAAGKNVNTTEVKLYLENTLGIAGATIPFGFAAAGSDIRCERIDFEGSRVEHFQLYPQIDNQKKKVLIGMIRALDDNIDDVLLAGSGLIATLHFSSNSGRALPQLKLTSWPLAAGELRFNMVDEKGNSVCGIKGETPIPISQGTGEPVEMQAAPFELKGNYPNPFNPETVIKFNLPQASPVTLKVYNVLGQAVNTLLDEPLSAGSHSVSWNGKNAQGHDVASGVYFYRISAGGYESIEKMTLMR